MTKAIILIAVHGAGLVVGWLVMVGTIWVIQSLVNLIFGTEFALNLWASGLLAYVVWYIFIRK